MRIKNLKAQNFYDMKELDIHFSEKDDIIFVFEPYDETTDKIPFSDSFFDLKDLLLFNDSYTYVKATVSKNTFLECTLTKNGVECTFSLKGNGSKVKKNGCIWVEKVSHWNCIIPENVLQDENGGWLETQLAYDSQEYFYPKGLEDVAFFKKDAFADSPTEFIHWEEFRELKRWATYNKIEVDLEKKLQEIINNFSEIKLNERVSVRLNEEKEYVLCFYGEEVTQQEDLELINFCGWINNLNILKKLCEHVGEDGSLPVFIDNVFDGILAEYKEVLIEKLRETGRQVFIISHKHDEEMEKLCDKVIEIKQN